MKNFNSVGSSLDGKPTQKSNGISKIFKGADEIKSLDLTSIDYLVDKLIPRGTLCALVGESDTGKSSLLRQLGVSIAYGDENFLGFKLSGKCRNVLYVSTEDGEMGTSVWLNKHFGGDSVNNDFLSKLKFAFSTDNIVRNLKESVVRECIDLIIVDSYADLFSGSMNNSNEVRAFLHQYASIASEYGVTVIFLHHTKKSSAGHKPNKNNILGSQGFEAKMRSVMMLTKDAKDSSLRHLCVVKNNYIDEANKNSSYVLKFNNHLSFENTGDRVILDELGEEDYIGYARKLKEEGKTLREIEEKLREEGYEVSKSSLQRKI